MKQSNKRKELNLRINENISKQLQELSKEFNNNQSMTICRLINDSYVTKQLETPT